MRTTMGETMEEHYSMEDYMKDCIDLFYLLQRGGKDSLQEGRFEEQYQNIRTKEQTFRGELAPLVLREKCGLSETEYRLFLFAFACELESGLCLEAQQKYQEKWPSVQYAFHLLSQVFSLDFQDVAHLCEEDSTLGQLFQMPRETWDQGILQNPLLLTRTAFMFLLTGRIRREDWYEFFEETTQEKPFYKVHEEARLEIRRLFRQEKQVRLLLNGRNGVGRRTLIKRICLEEQKPVLFVRMELMPNQGERRREAEKTLCLICRLKDPLVVLDFRKEGSVEASFGEEEKNGRHLLQKLSGRESLFVLTEEGRQVQGTNLLVNRRMDLRDSLSREEGKELLDSLIPQDERAPWQDSLIKGYGLNIGEFLERFDKIEAQSKDSSRGFLAEGLWNRILQEERNDSTLGRVIRPEEAPEKLILSKECEKQLETVISLAGTWYLGKEKKAGFPILFYGASGTGKTMAAATVAAALCRTLFHVDLSRIFDKYIGETEKHMDEIFRTAQRNNHILFFDEADVLFSKRTGIQDSHDRYSNVSTAYLLQRMEQFRGVVILATNLLDHFDDAFLRRIRFVIKFKELEEEDRERLWEQLLAGSPEAEENISTHALAKAVTLSPARIKMAVQTAKMMAVSRENGKVTKEQLQEALELEAAKDGTRIDKTWMKEKPNTMMQAEGN